MEQIERMYLDARERASTRNVGEPALIKEAEEGFSTGLRVAIAGLATKEQVEWVKEKIRTETNFSFGFICGVLSRLEAVKGRGYQASWQKRGETDGAMVNLERKWDRLDATVRRGAHGETKCQILGDLSVYGIKWLTLRGELDPLEFLAWVEEVRAL